MTSSTKSIIKLCIISGASCTPYTPFLATPSANSLLKNENKVGNKTHPCLSPLGQWKKSVRHLICEIFNIFPPTPAFLKTFHSILLLMVSNAFLKSTKDTYTFPDFFVRCLWTIAYKTNTLSMVKYPVRKPFPLSRLSCHPPPLPRVTPSHFVPLHLSLSSFSSIEGPGFDSASPQSLRKREGGPSYLVVSQCRLSSSLLWFRENWR